MSGTAAGQEGPKQAQLELKLKRFEELLSECKRVMTPKKVYCLGLADYVGAYWHSSRMRVAAAFYGCIVSLIGILLTLAASGNPSASDVVFTFMVLVLACGFGTLWLLGVARDHCLDDVKTLRENIAFVRQQIELLESLSKQLHQSNPSSVAEATAADTLTGFQALLGMLLAFEKNYSRWRV